MTTKLQELIKKAKQKKVLAAIPPPADKKKRKDKKKKAGTGAAELASDELRRNFALELLRNNFNATQAYLAIYPNGTRQSAAVSANRLYHDEDTQRYLTALVKQLHDDQKLDVDFIYEKWYSHATASPVDYLDFAEDGSVSLKDVSQLPRELQENLRSLNVTINRTHDEHGKENVSTHVQISVVDQQKAVEMMAKSAGLLRDKVDLNVNFKSSEFIEEAVARMKNIGNLHLGKVYDEDGYLLENTQS
jgi:hypothetical protein